MRSIALWVTCLFKCAADFSDKMKIWKTTLVFFLFMSGWNWCYCLTVNWIRLISREVNNLTSEVSNCWWSAVPEVTHTHTCAGKVLVLTFHHRESGGNSWTPKNPSNVPLCCIAGPGTPCCSILVKASRHRLFEVLQKRQTGTGLLVFPWQPALLWEGHVICWGDSNISSPLPKYPRPSQKLETKVVNASRFKPFFCTVQCHEPPVDSQIILKLK